jgi:ferric-dicitrate binding protein FerR (iron transport regulator)
LPRVATWQRASGWRTFGTLVATAAAAGLLFTALDSTARAHGESQRVAEPPPRQIATVAGQRAAVELSDGSHVRLSAGSRLVVSGSYGTAGRRREVTLVGEASFSVQHDSTRPFVVHTPYGVAEDLGTEFVVNTYPEVHGMRLAVRDGRVGIRAGASEDTTASHDLKEGAAAFVVLDKGDVATVTANGGLSVSRGQDVSTDFSGADGALVLRDVSLRDAVPILERWYGIRIHTDEDAVLSRHVSGTFHDGSAVAAIETIATAVERKIHWKGNTVTFTSHIDSGEPQ